jgi:CO dehydrogenase nickel-insertion accessory protein CooC1
MKITITGYTAEGKTTIASIIGKALRHHGLIVDNQDPDVHQTNYSEHQEKRIVALAARKEIITIEVVQLTRRN